MGSADRGCVIFICAAVKRTYFLVQKKNQNMEEIQGGHCPWSKIQGGQLTTLTPPCRAPAYISVQLGLEEATHDQAVRQEHRERAIGDVFYCLLWTVTVTVIVGVLECEGDSINNYY